MRSIESEGDTIDQAIERALRALDVTREQVQIDILTDATRGLLGFGGRKARIRATVRPPLVSRLEGMKAAPPRWVPGKPRRARSTLSRQRSNSEGHPPTSRPRERLTRRGRLRRFDASARAPSRISSRALVSPAPSRWDLARPRLPSGSR